MNNTTNNTDSKKANAPASNHGSDAGFQEKIMKQIRELGDSLERAGEKVEKSGLEMIGQAIYKLGNSLEHLQGNKKGVLAEQKGYSDKEFDDKSKTKDFADKKTPVSKVGGNDSQAY